MDSFPTEYNYLNGKPDCSATIRAQNADFQVTEIPSFAPDGTGEHWYIQIEKNGENSDWVAKELAKYFDVSSKEIGYAGKKDRHAITRQWFSVCLPGVKTIDLSNFDTPNIKVLSIEKHSRKLRTGALKGNRFQIRLTNVTDDKEFENRLKHLAQGVPNYFGEQRFGIAGGNLSRGVALLAGKFKERNRTKKGLYISAVRSWIFNYVLSKRIQESRWNSVMPGDVAMLEGSKSHFLIDNIQEIEQRLAEYDLHLTGPMWGRGNPITADVAAQWEQDQLLGYQEITKSLENVGLSQERRALRVLANNLQAECESAGTWLISFELPPGAFATSVLRELCHFSADKGNK